MQTTTRFRWLAALVLWLGPLLAAHATHLMGGDIAYSPVASITAGVPRYHVTYGFSATLEAPLIYQ